MSVKLPKFEPVSQRKSLTEKKQHVVFGIEDPSVSTYNTGCRRCIPSNVFVGRYKCILLRYNKLPQFKALKAFIFHYNFHQLVMLFDDHKEVF